MLKNYLKSALRNVVKCKAFSFISIAGLALGMACCILIMLWIQDEISYDRYHQQAANIYRIQSEIKIGDQQMDIASAAAPLGPALVRDYPEVKYAVRFRKKSESVLSYNHNNFYESNIFYADKDIFNVFSFEMIKGEAGSALEAPNTVVLTEEIADKYFGGQEPLGKILRYNNTQELTVTGVIRKPPSNSHFTFDILISMATYAHDRPEEMDAWTMANQYTYIFLENEYEPAELERKLPAFCEKYCGDIMTSLGVEIHYSLQPLTDIHLHSDLDDELAPNGDINYVYAFSAIAIIVLLMACVNLMNLLNARAANRAKEVGIRKSLGAHQKQLLQQFLGESFLISLLSMGLAMLIVECVLPIFRDLTGKTFDNIYFNVDGMALILVGLLILAGLASGAYPAFVLSRFKPVSVLKNSYRISLKSSPLTKLLVVLQFAISISLIIGTLIVSRQLNFMKNKQLGFDQEQMLIIVCSDDGIEEKMVTIKRELLAIDGVISASASMTVPGADCNINGYWPEGYRQDELFSMLQYDVDADFLDTYGIEIIMGRGFSSQIASDTYDAVIINEKALEELGWDNPIGKKMIIDWETGEYQTVIGVFKNFHHYSLYYPIQPMCLTAATDNFERLSLKLNTGNLSGTMKLLKNKWADLNPHLPFEFHFLDISLDRQYATQEKLGRIISLFSFLAISIGCLGLLGLTSFAVTQRTKEIGVRKVLGATIPGIIALLSKEFIILIAIANIIAWPAAYYFMNNWLKDFPYRISIGAGEFIMAAILVIFFALITICTQALKAALANPIDSLRHE